MTHGAAWLDAAPALIAAALFATLFLALALPLESRWPLAALDARMNEWLQAARTPQRDHLFRVVTQLGDPALVWAAAACAAVPLLLAGRVREAVALGLCVVGTAFLAGELKDAFGRARPLDPGNLKSLPSGHAALAAAFYLSAARIATRGLRRKARAAALIAAFALAAGIAFSRIYLGAHWLSDVLAGLALGCAAFSIFLAAWERAPARPPRPDPLRKSP